VVHRTTRATQGATDAISDHRIVFRQQNSHKAQTVSSL
jgi:hypothetical protein